MLECNYISQCHYGYCQKGYIWENTAGMQSALKNLLNVNSIVELNFERIRLLCSNVTFLPQEIMITLLSEIHFQHGLKFLILSMPYVCGKAILC